MMRRSVATSGIISAAIWCCFPFEELRCQKLYHFQSSFRNDPTSLLEKRSNTLSRIKLEVPNNIRQCVEGGAAAGI
jgi:hypothetical protein